MEKNWGGELLILSNSDEESVVSKIPPLSNRAIALVRDEQAWHAVTKITPYATQPRLSLQLEFWSPYE